MDSTPKVVIGMPLFNHASLLPEALESLLSQSFRDVGIVLVDDGTDDSEAVARRYMAIDGRIRYAKNDARLGMIHNWRKAYRVAREAFPGFDYFAWGSDHDVWHPRWLEELVRTLDADPNIVLSYPMNIRIAEDGEVFRTAPWRFDTRHSARPMGRLFRTCRGMSAGNMVYGLYRASALEKAGVFRELMLPDRMLLAELSLHGEFKQVPQLLWYRRYVGLVTMSRQRASFFPDRAPLYAYLPWWLTHGAALAWNVGVKGGGRPAFGPLAGFAAAGIYAVHGAAFECFRPLKWLWKNTRIYLLRPGKKLYLGVRARGLGALRRLREKTDGAAEAAS
jgi:glycosyltransferase involved in cell wall biosynthesis